MQGWKNNNDPWVPLTETNQINGNDASDKKSSNGMLQRELPPNPLHEMIDSQRYIESLEKKLEKLKSKRKEPTSKDIITSLALFQEDQMRRYVDSDSKVWIDDTCENMDTAASLSFLKRKLHPEQQALSAEELIELVKSDVVAISHEEEGKHVATNEQLKTNSANTQAEENDTSFSTTVTENWANFEDMNQVVNSEEFSNKSDENKT